MSEIFLGIKFVQTQLADFFVYFPIRIRLQSDNSCTADGSVIPPDKRLRINLRRSSPGDVPHLEKILGDVPRLENFPQSLDDSQVAPLMDKSLQLRLSLEVWMIYRLHC